ncbi:MAG: HAMP domain-containing histidine kinase [Lachnospiraceae bacterium]|nr:HAMP domain-containing histidine kinase [Lachnospiraceae bacterium]
MIDNKKGLVNVALMVMVFALIISAVIHIVSVITFNREKRSTEGCNKSKKTYMDVYPRQDSTSPWYKQDLDLRGAIYDASLHNNSKDKLQSWTFRFDVQDDCYLNQFWNGEVEVHQNVGTEEEVVERVNLAKFDRDRLKLDYVSRSKDLLIPLKKGDYFIYYPSKKLKEYPLDAGDEVKVGMILYYKESIDVSNYKIDYYYHRDFNTGIRYKIICILAFICGAVLIAYITSIYILKKAEKDMELRKSGLSCMSDLYSIIYMIDLKKDKLTPVVASEEAEKKRPKNIGAHEQLINLYTIDPVDNYKENMIKFVNLTTINERMAERNSISTEYISKEYGWCRVTFMAMDRMVDKPVERVLFTIQEIDDEKNEKEDMMGRIEAAETERKERMLFLANMSNEIREPLSELLKYNDEILDKSKDKKIIKSAKNVKEIGKMMTFIVGNMIDYFRVKNNDLELNPVKYTLKEMVEDIYHTTKLRVNEDKVKIVLEIDETLPSGLYGDVERVKQIIINLLANAVLHTEKGTITLAIYGKRIDEKTMHLLISVKNVEDSVDMTVSGLSDEEVEKMNEKVYFEEGNIGVNFAKSLLTLFDSDLKISPIKDDSNNIYFEIEQRISNENPVGKIQ